MVHIIQNIIYQGYTKGLLHTGVLSIQCVRLPLNAQFFFCQLITLVRTKIIYNICIYGNGEHFGMQYMVKDILYMNLIAFLGAPFFFFSLIVLPSDQLLFLTAVLEKNYVCNTLLRISPYCLLAVVTACHCHMPVFSTCTSYFPNSPQNLAVHTALPFAQ